MGPVFPFCRCFRNITLPSCLFRRDLENPSFPFFQDIRWGKSYIYADLGGHYSQLDSSDSNSLELEWINHPTFPLSQPRSWVDLYDLVASLQIPFLLPYLLGGMFPKLMMRWSQWPHWDNIDPSCRMMMLLVPKFVKMSWRRVLITRILRRSITDIWSWLEEVARWGVFHWQHLHPLWSGLGHNQFFVYIPFFFFFLCFERIFIVYGIMALRGSFSIWMHFEF